MKDDIFIKKAFENLNPSPEEKEKIWNGVESNISYRQEAAAINKYSKKQRKTFKKFAGTAAALLAVFFMLGVCAYAATGGKIADVFLKPANKEVKEAEEEVIKNSLNIIQRMETYAPELYACNGDYFVFAHLRGMVIYDRKKDCVASVVDLQEIECNNFNTQSRFTRIVEEDGKLLIFNEENGKADSIYYECDLTDLTNPQLTKKKTGKSISSKQLCNKWKKYKKKYYTDTFNSVPQSLTNFLNNNVNMYSENSFIWKAKNGSSKQSALIVRYSKKNIENIYYALFTLDRNTKKHNTVKLNIEVTAEMPDNDTLPKFVYTGGDAQIAAICEYMYNENLKYADKGTVYIPAPVIYLKEKKNNKIVILADLYHSTLIRNGNVLQDAGGGHQAAKLQLKKTGSGYKIVKVRKVRDGSYWTKDIDQFTKNHPGIRKKFYEGTERYTKSCIMFKKMLNMYLKHTGLNIVYYKDYGGDKEKLTGYVEKLPTFSYSGDDMVKKTVCDYMCQKQAKWYTKNGSVYLPSPDIYYIGKKDGRLFVFGNFEYETGYQYGGLIKLYTSEGRLGSMCLKPKGNGYVVEKFIYTTRDDMDWWEKVKDLTKEHPSAMKKFWDFYNYNSSGLSTEKDRKKEKRLVKTYAAHSGTDITSYRGIDNVTININ